MNDNNSKLITAVAIVILTPVVIGISVNIVNAGIEACNWFRKKMFDNKIENGLKDGSIIEVNGEYYEVPVKTEA